MSAGVSAEPSWNFTPLRIVNVHCVPSLFDFQSVASVFTSPPWLLMPTSVS